MLARVEEERNSVFFYENFNSVQVNIKLFLLELLNQGGIIFKVLEGR